MQFFDSEKKQDDVPLRFIGIGDSVTKNLNVYEYGNDIIAVDFGIGFPEGDSFGVDFIVPDATYLVENAHKVRGLFITHAHADHFAAVPYLLQQLNVPIYANKLTQEYIKALFEEKEFKNLKDATSFHLFNASTEPVELGPFKVSAFNVNHSVPGSLGLAIDTPQGLIIHMADFKVDFSPVIDSPIDFGALVEFSKRGVTCLVSDCLGSKSEGFIKSERSLDGTFPDIFKEYERKQIFITTISSNISRMHQIIESAIKYNRKVVPVGRSIDQSIKIARNLGYLPFSDDAFVDLKKAEEFNQENLVYIVAGCFGQSGSALDRLSMGEHQDLSFEKGAVVIFSSEPNPPGVDVEVERVESNLILLGVEVVDHTHRDDLHVSGHGHKGDLSLVASILKPKYFIPIGGTAVHLNAYRKMIGDMGYNKETVFALQEGDVVEFRGSKASLGERVPVTDMYIDGVGLSPVVIKDRETLSTDGVFVVVIPMKKDAAAIAGKVDIITRGFVYVKESKVLMGRAKDIVNKITDKVGPEGADWGSVKNKVEKEMQRFLYKETGRKPLIIVHSLFV